MRKMLIMMFTALLCSVHLSYGQDMKVGILFDEFASARWKIDSKILTEKFTELGVKSEIRVAHMEKGVQVKQANELIKKGVQALIVIATDAEEAKTIVELAKSRDVIIVAYDRLIPDPRVDFFISYDSKEVGRMQARAAIKGVPNGNFVLVNGPESDLNAIDYRLGQLEVINEYNTNDQIKIVKDIVLDQWHEMQTMLTLLDSKLKVDKINCFVAASDALSGGVIEFVSDETEMKRIYLTGQDASDGGCERIKSGLQNMTVLKPLKQLAESTALITYKLMQNEPTPELKKIRIAEMEMKGLLFTPILIDESNVESNEALLEQLRIAKEVAD
ncbi:MAG: substrate-binding domain-containing protein [Reichenbachiella sp.]